MHDGVPRFAVLLARAAPALLAAVLAAAAGCSQCPTCPKHTEPVHVAPPSGSH
jgi:hypothetical protein